MEKEGRYIGCPFGHKHIVLLNRYDDLKKCMEEVNKMAWNACCKNKE